MAKKFTLEEILNEYDSEGKRSGIRRSDNTPLSHGTLETEKLVHAAISGRPMFQGDAGYRTVTKEKTEENLEELVDIKSTISQIKAEKTAREIHSSAGAPLLQERFPTQQLRRERISFVNAVQKGLTSYPVHTEDSYDAAMKIYEEEEESSFERHSPNVRQMQDSTRAKEQKRGKRSRAAESAYAKESVAGTYAKPKAASDSEIGVKSKRRWEEEKDFYYQGGGESSTLRTMRQRVRRHTGWNDSETQVPDDMEAAKKLLCNLRNVIFFRFVALLFLTLVGAVFAFGENMGLLEVFTARGCAAVELGIGAAAAAIAFPTIRNGWKNFIRFHADSDSMAVLPLFPAILCAILVLIKPSILDGTVHILVPCAVFGLFCNAIGRLLVVRRALRNCNVLSKDVPKRVLSYVSQEETAEILTRGVVSDYPIVTSVRRADSLCDFLRYTYSNDMADGLCRRLTPICAGIALLTAILVTVIRFGLDFQLLWLGFFLTILTAVLMAGCCVASALVVNLPLERESRNASASDSAMLGYQSVDDFFDTNALLVEAADLFPKGSVQIFGMKVLGGAKVDDVLLDAASLVQHAGSILQNGFSEMIPDEKSLYPVEQFDCEDGLGLCGWINNRRVLFGGREMMVGHNIEGLPTKTREAELSEGGELLYLSVSGVLSAIFSIRISADSAVKQQMQALRQEQIALIIRSVDSCVTLRRISALFDVPEKLLKIIPTSMHHLFGREVADLGCVSASMTVGSGFGAARLLLGARRVRRAAMTGLILQVVSALLGLSLALIHIFIGAYEEMNAQFFLLYHLILTTLTALTVRIR